MLWWKQVDFITVASYAMVETGGQVDFSTVTSYGKVEKCGL
jgi:hypothetical protein